jgi:hypothetical protein
MRSVKGKFQNGVATPTEPIEGHEGESVLITFLGEDRTTLSPADDSGWQALAQLIENCALETGISDLAGQHDHDLYSQPNAVSGDLFCERIEQRTSKIVTNSGL